MTGDNYIKIAHKQVKMRKKNIKAFRKTTYRLPDDAYLHLIIFPRDDIINLKLCKH